MRQHWPSLAYSFEKLHMPEPNSGCWIWIGSRNMQGYAVLNRYPRGGKPKRLRAHIVGYQLYVGPVPKGLELDHKCRMRCCVNPAHLEPVTHAENVRRGAGAAHWRNLTHCKRGHPLSGDNVHINAHGWRRCRTCSRIGYHRRKQCSA